MLLERGSCASRAVGCRRSERRPLGQGRSSGIVQFVMPAEPLQIPFVLQYPGVFERITEPDKRWLYTIKAFQLRESSEEDVPALERWLEENEEDACSIGRPRRSFMTHEWADALLTLSGTVWFLDQATGIGLERVTRLCRYGMPWPLLHDGFEAIILQISTELTTEQKSYLQTLFQPPHDVNKTLAELVGLTIRETSLWEPRRVASNRDVDELEYYTRMSRQLGVELDEAKRICSPLVSKPQYEESPPGFATHERAQAQWEQIADLTGEPVGHVHQVARGLCCYLDCLVSYVCEYRRTRGDRKGKSQAD